MISIFEKNIVQHWENKKLARWDRSFETTCHKVGVMGTGEIGKVVMDALTALNYEVHGFSYSGISYKDYTVYNHSQLDLFLKNVNVVICLLPLTKETENFVNRDFFSIMNKGSCFFNLARGKILDDDALLWALDENILAGAYLDAFRQEPLPPDHPFWKHPDIMITPHVSGITHVKTGAAQMVKNYFSYEKNETLANEIDKTKGY